MRLYRIVAVFNPEHPKLDGTSTMPWKRKHHRQAARIRRGAWRVVDCVELRKRSGRDVFTNSCPMHGNELWTISDRLHRVGTLFNPAAALKRALAARRNNGKAA